MSKTFSIVYSNYTGKLFAWEGTRSDVKKYLGNREVIGTVVAADEQDAMDSWSHRTKQ